MSKKRELFALAAIFLVLVLFLGYYRMTGNSIVSFSPLQDKFERSGELHWSHRPITYRFDNANRCDNYSRILLAFTKIRQETGGRVYFKDDATSSDMLIFCSEDMNFSGDRKHVFFGEAEYSTEPYSSGKEVISSARINFYRAEGAEKCDYPAAEIHEILHTLGLDHRNQTGSIMQEIFEGCSVKSIDTDIVRKLRDIYR